MGKPVDDIEIKTVECGHCFGSGRVPSGDMIEDIQRALDRGLLSGDDLIELSRRSTERV